MSILLSERNAHIMDNTNFACRYLIKKYLKNYYIHKNIFRHMSIECLK